MIEECAAFPYGENDDLVDSMTQAMMRYRQGNFISLKDDYEDPFGKPPQREPEISELLIELKKIHNL